MGSTVGKTLRLGRIFRGDGRTVIVAMDHGVDGPIEGLRRPGETIEKLIEGGPDSVITTLGILKLYSGKLALLPSTIWSIDQLKPDLSYVDLALKLGVDAIKLSVFAPLEQREKYEVFGPLARACEEHGLPLLAEPVPVDKQSGQVVLDIERLRIAARFGAEVGADFVKVAYTGSPKTFRSVIKDCPVPVVIMGGPKMSKEIEVLKTVKGAIDAGAAGVALGRNIWQHQDPTSMVRAIVSIVHGRSSVRDAMKAFRQ